MFRHGQKPRRYKNRAQFCSTFVVEILFKALMVCWGVTTKEFCHCSVNMISKLNNIFFGEEIWNNVLLLTLNLVINISSDRFNKEFRDVCPQPLYISSVWFVRYTTSCLPVHYTAITNLMNWLLFIHKILFSSTCFEHQVLIFRRT